MSQLIKRKSVHDKYIQNERKYINFCKHIDGNAF